MVRCRRRKGLWRCREKSVSDRKRSGEGDHGLSLVSAQIPILQQFFGLSGMSGMLESEAIPDHWLDYGAGACVEKNPMRIDP